MSLWFTDTTVAFVKETISNLENTEKENKELEEKLHYYEDKLNQCKLATKNLSEEFRKSMYVKVDPDDDMQKPVLFDEAFKILCDRVSEYTEVLELGKRDEELLIDLYNRLTRDYYPGILDEIKD